MEQPTQNAKSITLTPSQQTAFNKFKEFINSDTKVFILKGYAGTGKTTLINSFVKELLSRKEQFVMLASTGRAAKIIRDRTQLDANTIHSTIYTFSDLNQDLDELYKEEDKEPLVDETGQLLLNFEFAEKKDTKYNRFFYLIDEASMVGDLVDKNPSQAMFGSGRVLNDLLRYDSKGKFIFVGDNCQLPPINETISPALSPDYLQSKFNTTSISVELKDIVRQTQTNDIVKAAQKVRTLYENPPVAKWPKFPLRGYKDIIIVPSQLDLINRYIKDIKTHDYNHATMLCRSNRESIELSNLIRPSLGLHDPVINVNDLLLVTQNNLLSGLMNGDLVRVTQINFTKELAGLTFINVEVEELSSKKRFTQFIISNILHSNGTNLTQDQQKALYLNYFFRMKNKGIKQKSIAFREGMYKDPYLNALRATFGYAITCHKSQGGEWTNVYLNIPRNLSYKASSPQYQWLYTAMTRAKEKLFVVEEFHLG